MNIAILDDMASDRKKAVSLLRTYFSRHPIMDSVTISEFESGEDFLKNFIPNIFQFIFIDYYMAGISGLLTAEKIRETDKNAVIIFITSSRDYAIDGYKVKASGYLLKPFEYHDMEEIMDLIDLKEIRDGQFIELETGGASVRILLNDIIYCDVAGHYVQVHTERMGLQRFRMTFLNLTVLLNPYKNFLPCYRGCIINMMKVKKIQELSFCMDNGERIPFRKKEQTLLMRSYSDFLFERVRGSRG